MRAPVMTSSAVVGSSNRMTSGRQPKEFGWIHELACPSENTIFAAELLNWRVQKLTLHPQKQQSNAN